MSKNTLKVTRDKHILNSNIVAYFLMRKYFKIINTVDTLTFKGEKNLSTIH